MPARRARPRISFPQRRIAERGYRCDRLTPAGEMIRHREALATLMRRDACGVHAIEGL